MSTREANNYSHLSNVPLKARDILNTTVVNLTDKKHSCDVFVSSCSVCGFPASLHHHTVHCTPSCKLFNFEHVNTADNFTLISNPIASVDFLSPDVIAPAGENPPPSPALAGAVISARAA